MANCNGSQKCAGYCANCNRRSDIEKGCEYCNDGKTLYQKITGTMLYINCSNGARALYFETEFAGVSINSAYIINYCPNCGRKLKSEN